MATIFQLIFSNSPMQISAPILWEYPLPAEVLLKFQASARIWSLFFFFSWKKKNLLSCLVIEHSNEIKMPLCTNVRLKGLLNVSKFNWAYQQSYFSKKTCTKMLLHFNVAKWFIHNAFSFLFSFSKKRILNIF